MLLLLLLLLLLVVLRVVWRPVPMHGKMPRIGDVDNPITRDEYE